MAVVNPIPFLDLRAPPAPPSLGSQLKARPKPNPLSANPSLEEIRTFLLPYAGLRQYLGIPKPTPADVQTFKQLEEQYLDILRPHAALLQKYVRQVLLSPTEEGKINDFGTHSERVNDHFLIQTYIQDIATSEDLFKLYTDFVNKVNTDSANNSPEAQNSLDALLELREHIVDTRVKPEVLLGYLKLQSQRLTQLQLTNPTHDKSGLLSKNYERYFNALAPEAAIFETLISLGLQTHRESYGALAFLTQPNAQTSKNTFRQALTLLSQRRQLGSILPAGFKFRAELPAKETAIHADQILGDLSQLLILANQYASPSIKVQLANEAEKLLGKPDETGIYNNVYNLLKIPQANRNKVIPEELQAVQEAIRKLRQSTQGIAPPAQKAPPPSAAKTK